VSRHTKIILITLVTLAALWLILVGSAVTWFLVNSLDIPVPDTSDLAPDRVRVSDEDNAYTYFSAAFESFQWAERDSRVESILAGKTWDDEFVSGLVSKNADTLALLKRGLTCAIYQQPEADSFKSHSKWVEMSKLMALKAIYERRTGQTEQSLESCLDLLRFGSLVTASPAQFIEYLVGFVILDRALDQGRQLLRESQLTEAQLVALSDQLNRISPLDEGLVRAIKMEFELILGMITRVESSVDSSDPTMKGIRYYVPRRYAFQPNRTTKGFADFCRTMIENASRPYAEMDLPEDDQVFPSGLSALMLILRPNVVAKMLLPAPNYLNPCFKAKNEVQVRLTALRLVVACRLYEMRHGQLPETLESLVPAFLDRVPCDPFDGKPFRYSPEHAIVYSVGKDLRDSGGSRKRLGIAARSRHTKSDANTEDLVYDIYDKTEQPAPAGQVQASPPVSRTITEAARAKVSPTTGS